MSVNVKLILIEILNDLSGEQFQTFKWRLVNGVDDKKISYCNLELANREKTIDEMLSHFGSSDALEKAREILDAVPRKDLAGKLMKTVKDTLREILEELSEENFNKFKSCLVNGDDDKKINRLSLEGANREKTMEMVDHFGSFDALETAEKVLEDMKVADKLMTKVPAKEAQERKKETLKEPTEETLKEPTEETLKETTEMERMVTALLRSEALARERHMPHASKTAVKASPLRLTNNFAKVKGAFVRQLLTTYLETLRKDQFKNFRDVLCETPVKDLVRAGDEFLDEPNTFQRDASLETLVEDLIGKFGRTYALTAAATVMEKIGRRDFAKELQGEEEALHVTECLRRKPKAGVQTQRTGRGRCNTDRCWSCRRNILCASSSPQSPAGFSSSSCSNSRHSNSVGSKMPSQLPGKLLRFLLWISLRFSLHFILPTAFFEGIPALERHSSKG
ncbi:uncharacterized protein LOC115643342 isoform X2 [Gopherus evgoodei]|uniref:uncharacterized protein LOC115643342 isoform X2 n=1 Tax=Gopherus evgoodei TaxID=1825980 RepID=UPI0011CF202A|nr:uncharacterized protein LOC115643342 isoform X2 [Gopherus evgoodei]